MTQPMQVQAQYVNEAYRTQLLAEFEQRLMLQAGLSQVQAENDQLRKQVTKLLGEMELKRADLVEHEAMPVDASVDQDKVNTGP